MLFTLETRLKSLLQPLRNHDGKIPYELLSDNVIKDLQARIIPIMHETFAQSEAIISKYSLQKQLSLITHPRSLPTANDYKIKNQMVFTREFIYEIDKLFGDDLNPLFGYETNNRQGGFYNLLQKAINLNVSESTENEKITPLTYCDQLMSLLISNNLITVHNGKWSMLPNWRDEPILFVQPHSELAYAGTLGEWLQYHMQTKALALFEKTSNRQQSCQELMQIALRSPLHALVGKYVLNAIHNAFKQKTPEALALLPASDALIKYQLQIALQETAHSYRPDLRFFPRGITNPELPTSRVKYKSYAKFHTELSIMHSLFDNPVAPDTSRHRILFNNKCEQSHIIKQHQRLLQIFADNPNAELLKQFGIAAEQIQKLNQLFCRNTPWNWLTATTNNFYMQGHRAVISSPWYEGAYYNFLPTQYLKERHTAVEQTFDYQINNWIKKFTQNKHALKLYYYSESTYNFLRSTPFPLMYLLAVVGLAAIGTLGAISFIAIIPLAVAVVLQLSNYCNTVCTSLLKAMSRVSTPKAINPSQWNYLITPMKSIFNNTVDNYYTGKVRNILQVLYPMRVIIGMALITLILISALMQKVILKLGEKLAIGAFQLANVGLGLPNEIINNVQFQANNEVEAPEHQSRELLFGYKPGSGRQFGKLSDPELIQSNLKQIVSLNHSY